MEQGLNLLLRLVYLLCQHTSVGEMGSVVEQRRYLLQREPEFFQLADSEHSLHLSYRIVAIIGVAVNFLRGEQPYLLIVADSLDGYPA